MHRPPMHHPPHPPLGVGLACVPPMRSNPPTTTTLGVGFVCLPPLLYVTPPPGTPCSYRRVSTCPSGLGCRGMSLSGAIGMGEGGGGGCSGIRLSGSHAGQLFSSGFPWDMPPYVVYRVFYLYEFVLMSNKRASGEEDGEKRGREGVEEDPGKRIRLKREPKEEPKEAKDPKVKVLLGTARPCPCPCSGP